MPFELSSDHTDLVGIHTRLAKLTRKKGFGHHVLVHAPPDVPAGTHRQRMFSEDGLGSIDNEDER